MNYAAQLIDFLATDLNEEQRTAVIHKNGPILIIAGPGSGKTRVITARIAYLILHEKQFPQSIVALTFTNKAAREMKERMHHFLGTSHALPFIGTFHAYCLRLLKQHALANEQKFVSIIDQEDQLKIIATLINRHGIQKQLSARQAAYYISRIKNNHGAFNSDVPCPHPLMQDIYRAYETEKNNSKCLDFDDLLIKTVELFDTNHAFQKQFQTHMKHILVDEYQDTNVVQHTLLKKMAQYEGKNISESICVVGDEDQSIYSWRGATIANMLNFQRDFPHTQIITIAQNYRSVKPIIDLANNLINCNIRRNKKTVWSNRQGSNRIKLLTCLSEYQESDTVITFIKALINNGKSFNSIALLYRTHAQSRALEEALIKHAIPYIIVGNTQFYERKEIKDMLAYLRLIINPYDRVSLFRILNVPAKGLGDKTEEIIRTTWHEQPLLNFSDLFNWIITHKLIPAQKAATLAKFIAIFDGLHHETSLTDALNAILNKTQYRAYIKSEYDDEEAQSRLQNLEELLQAMHYQEHTNKQTIAQFLEDVALMQEIIQDSAQTTERITLMTLHAAKGLEFDTVIITGLEEGILPATRSLDDEQAVEEERRLLYVGITRAREYLLITHANYRYQYGSMTYQAPSRFVAEMAPHISPKEDCSYWSGSQFAVFFNQWVNKNKSTEKEAAQPIFKNESVQATKTVRSPTAPPKQIAASFKKYQPVAHATYGTGTVLDVEKKANGALYVTVKFKTGSKKIASSFLQPL